MSLRNSWFALLLALPLQSVPAQQGTISPSSGFDLDGGYSEAVVGYKAGTTYDLVFGCGLNGEEFLRALTGTSWVRSPNDDFTVGPEILRQAQYAAPTDAASGYPDLFRVASRASANEKVGTVYFVRTSDHNLAKVRIAGYQAVDPNPMVCRQLRIEYVLYREPAKKSR
jgi:hypothetical protein